jgi:hypothetical protein
VGEFAEPFATGIQAVSKHPKLLEDAGLVTRGRADQQRPARLAPRALHEAAGWLERCRKFRKEGYARLDGDVQSARGQGPDAEATPDMPGTRRPRGRPPD